MRTKYMGRIGLLAITLVGILLLSTSNTRADDTSTGYALPDSVWPVPWGSTRPEDGGFYAASEFVLWRQTNPLQTEVIGNRGFYNTSLQSGAVASTGGAVFVGSDTTALTTAQVRGPESYQPGFIMTLGWKFEDESTVALSWTHLFQVRYQAVATAAAPNFNYGVNFADSFLSAPVYNFPNDYAGLPGQQVGVNVNGQQFTTYGIWDGASLMQESFVQREEAYDLIWRKPLYENENYRFSSLLGPRFFWIWEKYDWKTTNFGFTQSDGPTAEYSNIDSNRMYGYNVGCSQEWYWGHGFACQLDTDAAGFLNVVKERTEYSTGGSLSGAAENKRARTDYTVVPSVDAKLLLTWYPIENVQLRMGYDLMAFFNTIGSEMPVDFNYSSVNPHFNRETRIFDGWQLGLSIVF